MNPIALSNLLAHWESERRRFLDKAHEATKAGRPALTFLRTASQCEARRDKLVRLANRASLPRAAA